MFDGWCCPGPGNSWGNPAAPLASKDAMSPIHKFCSGGCGGRVGVEYANDISHTLTTDLLKQVGVVETHNCHNFSHNCQL